MVELLEKELERLANTDNDARDFWARYQNVKAFLSQEYYRWIQANCPFFTDHGEQHIQSVIQAASSLLSKQLNNRSSLTALDIFLILSGILWHDVGNVYGRSGHADRVAEMTQQIKLLAFPNIDIHRIVDEISKAHGGKNGLDGPRQEEDCSTFNKTYTVYPKALAAIVRFADEISENRSRISQVLLSSIPEENRIFWEFANCISAARPEPARKRVIVTISLQIDSAVRKYSCQQYCNRSNCRGEISLIEYILSRLEKMNNERVYCSPEFSRYVAITEIEARFTLLRNTQRFDNYEIKALFKDGGVSQASNSYPCIQIVEDFFVRHPNWQFEKLQEVLAG